MSAADTRSSLLALAVVALAGIAAFAWASSGFRVVTSETARRLAVAAEPLEIDDARLIGPGTPLHELRRELAADGRVALVDFIYTRCTTLCTTLGNEYQQLQREIAAQAVSDRVRLLSISFDPRHDTPEALAAYARRLRADSAVWRFATIDDASQLTHTLETFGIVVIDDEMGGYVHNAAIHVVTPDGRLHRIRDLGQWRQALADALALGAAS